MSSPKNNINKKIEFFTILMSCKPKFTCDKTFYLILTIYEKYKYYEGQTKKISFGIRGKSTFKPYVNSKINY